MSGTTPILPGPRSLPTLHPSPRSPGRSRLVSRVSRFGPAALALVLNVGCQAALSLDDYAFGGAGGAAGSGDSGAAGSPSPSPAGGSGGNGGSSGGDGGGSGDGGSGGVAAGPSTDAGADAGPELVCAASERCVPPIPIGWQGPIVVNAVDPGCPGAYPTALGEVHTDFQAGAASCSCNCLPTGVSCRLLSSTGNFFAPAGSCDSPPVNDDCLSAVSVAGCSPSVVDDVTPSSFETTLVSCGGGAAAGACSGGTCYPASGGSAPLCISAVGDVACPAGFPQRAVYFQNIADDRACSPCNCAPQGQVCQLEIEVCSVGFYNETLTEGNVCTPLSSSDGDGVTLLSTAVLEQGTCGSSGGVLEGSSAAVDPITVCCME